ncbi:porin family protein [Parabacteroides sp. ASD2025]|uniref:porin family protein n=1 Tax=Parabacteroides sp. ASD2025 TaxID=3415987 RepID=UPI003CF81BD1
MYRKLFLLVFTCLYCFTCIKGQGLELRAGMNLSSYLHTEGARPKVGANVGVMGDIRLSRYFHLQPGLMLNGRGASTQEYVGMKGKITGYWLDIPVYASFRIPCLENTAVRVGFGPYYGVGLFGKTSVTKGDVSVSINTFGDVDHSIVPGGEVAVRQDFGVGIEAGVEHKRYLVVLNYMQGCTDNLAGEGSKNFLLSLSVGYKFRL